jgi:hypothetical protein
MIKWLESCADIDAIYVYLDKEILGVSIARNKLLDMAYTKYGDGHVFVMMDDDCYFTTDTKLKEASIHFNDPTIGIVGMLNMFELDEPIETEFAQHCFMIRSDIIGNGIRYSMSGDILDEIQFSFDAWLAGWNIIVTNKCRIIHHFDGFKNTNKNLSVLNECYVSKKYKPVCVLTDSYRDLVDYESIEYLNMQVPITKTIKSTDKAKYIHKENSHKLFG